MHFSFHASAPALSSWVKGVWCAHGTRADFAVPEPIVPDGCVEIIFNLAAPFLNRRGLQPLALIAGQMTGPVTAVATGDVDLFASGRGAPAPRWGCRCGNCATS
jgi:hypothetical protein